MARAIYLDHGLKPWASDTRLMAAMGQSPQTPATAPAYPQSPGNGFVAGGAAAPSFNTNRVMQLGLLADIAGFPSVSQLITQSPEYQAAVKSEEAAAQYPYQHQLQADKPTTMRPGGSYYNPATGQTVYAPQMVTITNPDGSTDYAYVTPEGVKPTGLSAGLSPGAKITQEESARAGVEYGGQANTGQGNAAPATPAATPNMVPGGAVAPAAASPSAASKGIAPSAPKTVDLSGFVPQPGVTYDRLSSPIATKPGVTARGTTIPPLTAMGPPKAPYQLQAQAKDQAQTENDMASALPQAQQAIQRLQTIADALKRTQSGSWAEQKASVAADLKALGVPDGMISSMLGNPADVQLALHENYRNTIQNLKASGVGRITNAEFEITSENSEHPNLQPEANLQMLAEDMGVLRQVTDLSQDWIRARSLGWTDPLAFKSSWYTANPLPKYVEQTRQQIGPLKGMAGNTGTAAGSSRGQPGASTSGPNPYRPGQAAIVQGHRYVYDGKA